jgi:hypothetical protein
MFVTSANFANTSILDCMFAGQFVTRCDDLTQSRETDEETSNRWRIKLERAQVGITPLIIYDTGRNFSRSVQIRQPVNLEHRCGAKQ